jgi:LacI family transcriptional regulator
MQEKAGIRQVAERANVSPATVSRVFNQHPNVRPTVRRRVLKAAGDLQYAANRAARRGHVTVLVEGFSDLARSNYHASVLGALVPKLAAAGLRPDVIPVETLAIDHLARQYTEAVLAMVWSPDVRQRLRQIDSAPLILVNDYDPAWHGVMTNHRQGVRLAVNHLREQGHSRIGLIRYYEGSWGDQERYAGFLSAIRDAGLQPLPELVISQNAAPTDGSVTELMAQLSDLLMHAPTALIVCSEDLALPTSHALYRLNRRVPEDISLVGFECPELSAYLQPPMTTIDQNTSRLADHLTRMVEDLRQSEPDTAPQHIVLDNDLVVRHSARRLAEA